MVVMVLPAVRSSAVQGGVQQPVPERCGVRVGAQDLLGQAGLAAGWRPSPGRRRCCGRSTRRRGSSLAAPWRLRRRRTSRRCRRCWRRRRRPCRRRTPSRAVRRSSSRRTRRSGPTPARGNPGASPKGSSTATGRPCRLRRVRVSSRSSGLVKVTNAAPGAGQRRRGQHVQGLAAPLRAVHAGGPVKRHPQFPGARRRPATQRPAHLRRVEPGAHRTPPAPNREPSGMMWMDSDLRRARG